MNPALTQIGAQMSNLTGVRAIMKDIIETLQAGKGQEFINLSAGNPLILSEVEQLWQDCTAELLARLLTRPNKRTKTTVRFCNRVFISKASFYKTTLAFVVGDSAKITL